MTRTYSENTDGAEFRARRAALGLSLRALAEASGALSHVAVAKVESGRRTTRATRATLEATLDRLEN